MATNLQFIKNVNVQTASSTVQITDCFTDNYDVYKIVISDWSTDGSGNFGQVRFIDSGGSSITTNYDYAYQQIMASYSFAEVRNIGATQFRGIGGQDQRTTYANMGCALYVFNPTDTSSYTFVKSQSSFTNSGDGLQGYKMIGVQKSTSDVTGIEFYMTASNIDFFRASVYGVK